ncbi:MAG: homoserine dehydrogenase [Acidaminococcales bacterium]|jgi:homoserine dehydrogenase|nr:homoserine dehydrogenase [Acidaminococcales bacterium]
MYKKRIDTTINVGLLGAGTIGRGVIGLLRENALAIAQKAGTRIKLKTVLEKDPALAEELAEEGYIVTQEINDIVNDPEISIVVELIGRVEPARSFMAKAIENGKHVVTANKDVIASHGRELLELAEKKRVDMMFEASVGGGIPIIRPLKQCLAANGIHSVMGIVNGTTNYMLGKMIDENLDYDAALKESQEKGYAEKDPAADVGGLDAARKIAILASIAFNTKVALDDVFVEGIQSVDLRDIKYAAELGYAVKLLAIAKYLPEHGIDVRVHPAFLPKEHPLANVKGVFNAIFVTGDYVGDVMFYGQGAGRRATASAVCGDIIDIARDIASGSAGRILCTCFDEKPVCSQDIVATPFYTRMLVTDKPGVLAAIAAAFGHNDVSLRTVLQKSTIGACAELVVITHKVCYKNLSLALQSLKALPSVDKICAAIRVEDNEFA